MESAIEKVLEGDVGQIGEDQQVSAQYENEINEIGKLIKLKQICLSFEEENRV